MQNGLKALRLRANLTQAQAAALMNLSKSGYVKIETGARKLSDRHIRAAMKAFSATERQVMGAPESIPSQRTDRRPKRDLSAAEAQTFAQACMILLEENADGALALQWLEALIEAVQQRGAEEDYRNPDLLRAKVQTVATLARAGLLTRGHERT